jgi:hypothetical protein
MVQLLNNVLNIITQECRIERCPRVFLSFHHFDHYIESKKRTKKRRENKRKKEKRKDGKRRNKRTKENRKKRKENRRRQYIPL